jgi:hypothetical protein
MARRSFCRRRCFTSQVPLDPEMNAQNYSDYGYGAEHQNRKKNFDHHRHSG